VNIIVALMLGILFLGEGNEGSRVLDNYNLLFACLIHNMMTPMMITILTCEYTTKCQTTRVAKALCTYKEVRDFKFSQR
jgi:transposase